MERHNSISRTKYFLDPTPQEALTEVGGKAKTNRSPYVGLHQVQQGAYDLIGTTLPNPYFATAEQLAATKQEFKTRRKTINALLAKLPEASFEEREAIHSQLKDLQTLQTASRMIKRRSR